MSISFRSGGVSSPPRAHRGSLQVSCIRVNVRELTCSARKSDGAYRFNASISSEREMPCLGGGLGLGGVGTVVPVRPGDEKRGLT